MLSLPRPVFGGAPTSPAWDPWLCPTPAPDPTSLQMFTGSLLPTPTTCPHPQATRRPQRKKHKRETPPFLKTTVHLFVAFPEIKESQRGKKKENCKPRKLLEKTIFKTVRS